MSSFYVPTESLLQSRAFRRLLGFSLAGHLAVFLALVIHPFRQSELIATSPVMVQMVSMPKAAVPKAAPAPAKAVPKPPEEKPVEPPPPPPKPVVKEIVIPKEPRPLPEKPKPAQPKTPPPSAEELLAKMTERVEAEEAAKAPPQEATTEEVTGEAPAATEFSPGRFDPVLSPWLANVRARVRSNWSGASVCKGEPQFDVDIDAAGTLTHIELVHSSGDSYCDDTAERALRKSNPLPPPPQAMSFTFNLNPKDMQ